MPETAKILPWERPDAPEHVRVRQPVNEIKAPAGFRLDLPKRREPDELSLACQGVDFGIAVMTHRGSSNGRLSVCLSSIPENYPVLVSSDSIDPADIEADRRVCEHHGVEFSHFSPWAGRAAHAIGVMRRTSWQATLFLCDDVFLMPEAIRDGLRWYVVFQRFGIPLGCLTMPGWETYREHVKWGFDSWGECLEKPWRLEIAPPNPAFRRCPSLYKNPFGACMIINRKAYEDVGGFSAATWAHDDYLNHLLWLSDKWVCAAFPGRGYMHFGAQSGHFGETEEYVGTFKAATGMTAEESGKLQDQAIDRWVARIGELFVLLGGTPRV